MKVDRTHPTKEQLQELANYPENKAVVMVNILRFKDKTEAGDESGESAYERYGKNVFPLLHKVGGRLLWRGRVRHTIIGDATNQPHLILLIEYPSTAKFLEMSMSPEYMAIMNDRTIALEYGGLLASETEYFVRGER